MLSKVIDGNVALVVATDIDLYLFQTSLGISLLRPSNLPAITTDGDDAQQVNEHCQPFSISQTRHLLRHTSLTIQQVCYESGFNDVPHFCRLFKRSFGETPKEYRG